MADGAKGVKIFDISGLKTWTSGSFSVDLIGFFKTTSKSYDVRVSNNGKYLFIADGAAGVSILDITTTNLQKGTKASPKEFKRVAFKDTAYKDINDKNKGKTEAITIYITTKPYKT